MNDDRLYDLLPAVYRQRDHEQGQPLRALLTIIQEEINRVEADLEGLYDNWFVETAAEWLLPYIGDLLGVTNLHTVQGTDVYSLRAYIANTLTYRQRKGTAAVSNNSPTTSPTGKRVSSSFPVAGHDATSESRASAQ